MASYKLRSADLDNVRKVASKYAQLDTGYRSWMPVETISRAYTSKWYTLEEIPAPALSVDGADYMGVRTARLEGSNPLLFMRYKFHWDITEVEAARRNGIPLQSDDAEIALRMINDKIAQMAIEGLDWPDVISGATEVGTDLGGTLDLTVVGTADAFITHAATAYNHMITNGFRGPYHWIVSDGIAQYLGLPLGAGGGSSQGNYIDDTFGFTTYIERSTAAATLAANIETGLEDNCWPMVYTADDGIWVCLAASPENMAIQEVHPPRFTVNPEINRDTNKYEGYVEWQGTVRFTHAASAAFMEDVDVV
jgi:hypothetical protein